MLLLYKDIVKGIPVNDLKLRERVVRLAHIHPELRHHLMAAIVAAAMPEADFWGIVDDIGWGHRTTDYKAIKRTLLRNLSPNQAAAFSTTFAGLQSRLYKVITDWEKGGDTWLETGRRGNPRSIGLGDDSFGDLLAHIIGLGKREYTAVMRNPQLAKDRVVRGDYKESFAYAVPHTSDYAMLDVSHYQERGEQIVALVGWLGKRPEARGVQSDLRVLIDGFDLLTRHRPHDFVAQETALVSAAKTIGDWWNTRLRDLGHARASDALLAAMPETLMSPGHLYWAVRNLITDMRDFLFD